MIDISIKNPMHAVSINEKIHSQITIKKIDTYLFDKNAKCVKKQYILFASNKRSLKGYTRSR